MIDKKLQEVLDNHIKELEEKIKSDEMLLIHLKATKSLEQIKEQKEK